MKMFKGNLHSYFNEGAFLGDMQLHTVTSISMQHNYYNNDHFGYR